jgi:response regulator RpfG family c-di-GMP phosphodiesterase
MSTETAELAFAAAPGAAAAEPAARVWTVLCVDDEPNILSSLRRLFRGAGYRILLAGDAEEALEKLAEEPVDLVLSDMRMPGASGAQLLEQVHLRWPGVLRLLLTGQSDMASTIAAINRGAIYRYITKPWSDEDLLLTVRQALDRRALEQDKERLEALTRSQNEQLAGMNATLEAQVAERTAELVKANNKLSRSYLSSIKVFANLIELRGEQLRGHARRVADLSRRTAALMGVGSAELQQVFVAGLLHDVGQLGLSDELLALPVPRMSPVQKAAYERHPVLAEQALTALDDMQPVAALIRAHHERHDGLGYPDRLVGDAIPLGARILAVADTWDDLQNTHLGRTGLGVDDARLMLSRGRGSQFDPAVLDAFLEAVRPQPKPSVAVRPVPVDQLRAGMVLAAELRSPEGVLLLAADQVLSAGVVERLQALARRDGLALVLQVRG